MKKPDDPPRARKELYAAIHAGELSLAVVVRRLRKLTGKTQVEFAEWLGIAPRIIMNIEREKGNPTLKTLNVIGAPFGLTVTLGVKSKQQALAVKTRSLR